MTCSSWSILVVQRNSEGVERVVVGGKENVAVANGHSSQMSIGVDCGSAGKELLAGRGVHCVKGCVMPTISGIERKHDPVGDGGGRRVHEILRNPGRRQRQMPVLVFHLERNDAAVSGRTVGGGEL